MVTTGTRSFRYDDTVVWRCVLSAVCEEAGPVVRPFSFYWGEVSRPQLRSAEHRLGRLGFSPYSGMEEFSLRARAVPFLTERGSVTRSGPELAAGSVIFQARLICGTAAGHKSALRSSFADESPVLLRILGSVRKTSHGVSRRCS